MSTKLSVYNVPGGLSLKELQEPFSAIPGFKEAEPILNNSQLVGMFATFTSVEAADNAKRNLNSYRFMNSHQGIVVDFAFDDQKPGMPHLKSDLHGLPFAAPGNHMVPNFSVASRPMSHVLESYVTPQPQVALDNTFRGAAVQPGRPMPHPPSFSYPTGATLQSNPFASFGGNPPTPQMLGFHTVSQPLGPLFAHAHSQPGDNSGAQHPYFPLLSNAQPQYLQFPGMGVPSLPVGDSALPEIFKVPNDSTNCLYIEGIPIDAKEREVAHIFRPYPGFITARLITKEAKTGRKFYYCFVDFENNIQATIAQQNLQGYRFHKKDKKGLSISYAKPTTNPNRTQNGNYTATHRRKRSRSSDDQSN